VHWLPDEIIASIVRSRVVGGRSSCGLAERGGGRGSSSSVRLGNELVLEKLLGLWWAPSASAIGTSISSSGMSDRLGDVGGRGTAAAPSATPAASTLPRRRCCLLNLWVSAAIGLASGAVWGGGDDGDEGDDGVAAVGDCDGNGGGSGSTAFVILGGSSLLWWCINDASKLCSFGDTPTSTLTEPASSDAALCWPGAKCSCISSSDRGSAARPGPVGCGHSDVVGVRGAARRGRCRVVGDGNRRCCGRGVQLR
jgi:hypothetical protein